MRNILDIFTPTEVSDIQSKSYTLDHQPKIQAAMNANPNTAWLFPEGGYNLFSTTSLSLPAGIRWVGDGCGKTEMKVANDGTWGIEQLNPNGANAVRGFCASGIRFLITNNGIRLNSVTGGYDDTPATQYYIMRPYFEDCEFGLNGNREGKTLLQFNKCFNGQVTRCLFNGGAVQMDFRGSDINSLTHSRLDNAKDIAVQSLSIGTFGSSNLVFHNDINNPKNRFYKGNDRDGKFIANHCELDGNQGSDGTGGKQAAAIEIISGGGGAFHTTICDNRMEVEVYADNWLKYRGDNPYRLTVEGNSSSGPGGCGVDFSGFPYINNSGGRVLVRHGNNVVGGGNYFPMNSVPTGQFAGGDYALLDAHHSGAVSRGGFVFRSLQGELYFSGDASASTNKCLEFSDWTGYPGNNLVNGHFTIVALLQGDAGMTANYEVLDGSTSVETGVIGPMTALTWVHTSLLTTSPRLFTAGLKIRFWSTDTTHGRFFIHNIRVF